MRKESETFIKESVVGIGVLSGLWIAVGVNPESEIINAFAKVLVDMGSNLGFLFYLIPIIALIGSLLVAWEQGGKGGLAAIAIGFLGGIFLISQSVFGLILIVIGIILGAISTK